MTSLVLRYSFFFPIAARFDGRIEDEFFHAGTYSGEYSFWVNGRRFGVEKKLFTIVTRQVNAVGRTAVTDRRLSPVLREEPWESVVLGVIGSY